MEPFSFFSESFLESDFPMPDVGVKSSEVEADESNGAMEKYLRNVGILRQALEEAPSVTQAAPKRRVEIPTHPDEGALTLRSAGEVWGCLNGWAGHYGVGTDQALLICACAAAHAAGSGLEFGGSGYQKHPAPTLIAATEDSGLLLAISGALRPLREIEQDLIGRYEVADGRKAKPSMEEIRAKVRRERLRQYDPFYCTNYARLNPEEQAEGVVRILLEGKPPGKPHRALEAYHHHAALALLRVERLPQTTRARENRLEALDSMVRGFRRGTVCIRGFIHFDRDDLEWVLCFNRYLRTMTLPVGGAEESVPDAPLRDEAGKLEFDRIHGVAMREVLRLRFDRADPMVNFRDGEDASHFGLLRATYRQEMYSVSHLAPMCEILPDLFVWYLLRLSESPHVKAEEMQIGERAMEAARTLRRKVAAIYDRHDALVIARKRQKLARKLVNRLKNLRGSCTRRDLARGLDKQRMDAITPIIELLIRHQVIGGKGNGIMMRRNERLDEIGLEPFMPPLEDVPYSGTRRLRIAEERQATERDVREDGA